MQYAIRNSEPGSLLVEDSKLKMDSNTSVCFDIPGGRKDRRRDLGQDAPMLCSDAAPADKDADAAAVADTADSYEDDPLHPPVQPPGPPPTPGEVPSGFKAAVVSLA